MLLHLPLLLQALLLPAAAAAAPVAAPAPSPESGQAAEAQDAEPSSGRGRIRGEVGFSRREKLLGATVVLFRREDPSRLVLTSTDEDGIFAVEGIPEGAWSLVILRDGLQPAAKEGIEVRAPFRAVTDVIVRRAEGGSEGGSEAGPLRLVDLAAAGAAEAGGAAPPGSQEGESRLLVRARGRDGAPREGARFRLRGIGGLVDPIAGQTAGSGTLELPAPPAGDYALEIESPGDLPIRVARLRSTGGPLTVTAVLVARPYFYPGTPTDLLPEEKPLPPSEPRAAPPAPPSGQEPERTAK